MNIYISTGEGHGKTPLSAFDAALQDSGIANYNLVYLSSIIPLHSTIKLEKFQGKPEEYGHRLYLVRAEMRSREAGKYIGAGLGWYQLPNGGGVFVEHEDSGDTKEAVHANLTKDITDTVTDLCERRQFSFQKNQIQMALNIARVSGSLATSVIVAAVYKAEPWV